MPEPTYFASGAAFSPCRRYRYELFRLWDAALPIVAFVMLNPSTADETQLDPTLRRCVGFAQSWGYGGMLVGNVFALRSTDPSALYEADDPVGPGNDGALLKIAARSRLVVAGWGCHGELRYRADNVKRLLANASVQLHCLKLTADGHPGHPLYLPKTLKPIPFGRRTAA